MSANSQRTVEYRVQHETEYEYAADVTHAHQLLHLTPRVSEYQECLTHSVLTNPYASRQSESIDSFGNAMSRLELDTPHRHLLVTADMTVKVSPRNTIDAKSTPAWSKVGDSLSYSSRPRSAAEIEASMFRMESPHVKLKRAIREYAAECFPRGAPLLVCADELLAKLHRELSYAPKETTIGTSVMDLLETRRGVCQDFAHLMIACFRSHGLAARYVSGYLRTTPVDGAKKLTGADASHAWVAVYIPTLGWVDLDPTNGVRVDTDHITLAWGRDFSDVSPLRGIIVGGGDHELMVRVTVTENTGP